MRERSAGYGGTIAGGWHGEKRAIVKRVCNGGHSASGIIGAHSEMAGTFSGAGRDHGGCMSKCGDRECASQD